MHRGEWAGSGLSRPRTMTSPGRGPRSSPTTAASGGRNLICLVPGDLVMTLGRNHNDGFVVPSLDMVFVRLGDGGDFPKDFEKNSSTRCWRQ